MHGYFRATAVPHGAKRSKPITLRPLHPNVGIERAYQKKLDRLVKDMNRSVVYWLRAAYRANPPVMAMDDILPTNALTRAIAELRKRWFKQFDQAAPALARYFSLAVQSRTDKALAGILRRGGFSVRFQPSQAMQDVFKATLEQNVSLIKSIPEQYLKNVEGMVMRSVQRGRDIGGLVKELEDNYGVTRRRAAFIAQSQNNLATSSMNRVRQTELGITQAKWKHSGGGRHPRPTHVKAGKDGVLYDVNKGWYDPAVKKFILPGELPHCRCVSISVIPGFS